MSTVFRSDLPVRPLRIDDPDGLRPPVAGMSVGTPSASNRRYWCWFTLLVLVYLAGWTAFFRAGSWWTHVPPPASVSTLIAVIIRNRDPAEEDVPTVLFSASDSET